MLHFLGVLFPAIPLEQQVQTIGFLSHLRSHKIYGPFIVIGPLSTLPNWVSEFQRWCPDMPALLYHGSRPERAELRRKHLSGVELWSLCRFTRAL